MDHSSRPSFRERFNISRLALQFPWLTLGFWIAVMVAGILAFSSLKYALFPDITFPVVVVNTSAPLTSATDTESKLTQPIEQQLNAALDAQGLEKIRSSTYPGRSLLSLSFSVGTQLEAVTQQVENVLKQVKLPEKTEYTVTPINLNEAGVVSYALDSDRASLAELTKTAQEQILPEVAKVPGVLKVNLLGVPAGTEVKQPAKVNGVEQPILTPGSSAVRFNGQEALAFEVIKRGDANTLEVVKQVEQTVERLRKNLPQVTFNLAATQAEYINQATHSTIDALIEAIALSVIIIFPFLWNWKATIISALAIPTSLLGTFIVMAIFGYNLETITLLALALVIGIIVDDAIVDVENIIRHLDAGEPPRQAVIAATAEIGLAVTAATLTVVAVFLPVAFMQGVIGQFFQPFGITVSAAVLMSLLVARTLSPLLAAYWLRPNPARLAQNATPEEPATRNARRNFGAGFERGYRRLLDWSLHHRWVVVGLALLSMAGGVALIPLIPTGFIPKLDRGEFNVTYTAPLPAIPSAADLAKLAAGQRPPNPSPGATSPTESTTAGQPSQIPAGVDPSQIPAGVDPSQIPAGVDPAQLAAANAPKIDPLKDSIAVATKLEDSVRKVPEVESVFTTIGTRQQPNKGTLYVKLRQNRTVHTAQVQDRLRQGLPAIDGVTTSVEDIQFVDTGGEKPLQLALIGKDPLVLSDTAKAIQRRVEKLPGFKDVTTSAADNTKERILEIDRVDGQRVAYVSANLGAGVALGAATEQVTQIANEVKPPDVSLDLGGDSARAGEVFGSFGGTLALATLCIVLVLVVLFRSILDPLVIAISLPLSILGALLAALLTRSDFGIISVIGMVFLLGLANKNAILLVDYIKQIQQQGVPRNEAILTAAPTRLRPIMMTTASTILGMMPIALGLGAGSELRAPMAVSIVGGLVTSTILSLLVIPVVYALVDELRARWLKRGV